MKAIQQIINSHFKKDGDVNILYFPVGGEYEQEVLKLPYNFYKAIGSEFNLYGSLRFDFVLSQGIEKFQEGKQVANSIHCPHLHIENQPFNGNEQLKQLTTHEIIHPWNWIATSWGRSNVILPPKDTKSNLETRELDCIYLDVDQQTYQLGMAIAQKYPCKQTRIEDKDFSKIGILVSTVGQPSYIDRILDAVSNGTIVIAWDTPFFQELIINGSTGFLVKNPEEMASAIENLLKNPYLASSMHQTILNTVNTKFSRKNFENKWKKIIQKYNNFIFKGE